MNYQVGRVAEAEPSDEEGAVRRRGGTNPAGDARVRGAECDAGQDEGRTGTFPVQKGARAT